jgi:lysostaphin
VQIILVDKRMARALTLTFTRRHLLMVLMTGLVTLILLSGMFSFLTFRAASEFQIPIVSDVISFISRAEMARKDQFVRDNVSALARKLGEVQAQLMRLDAIGERCQRLASAEEFRFQELPTRRCSPGHDAMTLQDLDVELQRLAESVDQRADYLSVIEAELQSQQVRQALLPHSKPLADGYVGSGFGWRTDPFTGTMARHEGIDFSALPGTPIHAAAGGVVVVAEMHPVYGNVVEIDHGNALMTRYAHASKLFVKQGDIVKRGQKLAEVGSTGRSTGPHLHFEVHHKGLAQNPAKFLFAAGSPLRQQNASSTARVDLKALAASSNARN